MPKDDDLLKRLLKIFKIEAREHVQTIATSLVELEKASTEKRKPPFSMQLFVRRTA